MNLVVVKGTSANAFSVPGGWVYVNEALLRNAENEAELANVVGHETGHIVLGHVMNRLHQAQTLNIAFGIASLLVHSAGATNTFNLAELIAGYGFLNFSRQQEYQADHEGVILASRAGYNPWGMVWFFQRLEKLYGDAGFEQYVQDHPSTKDRVARIEGFFKSNPTQFARWSSQQIAQRGLPLAYGADARLQLKGV
jgi:predicted Zn-dependent protease